MMRKVDLHTHSSASDGLYSPAALIDLAHLKGVVALAITDHDTVDGLGEAERHAAEKGLTFVPGVEFSIDYPRGTFHLVGLRIDFKNRALADTLGELKKKRDSRGRRIVEDLRRNGVDIRLEEVLDLAAGAALGKPHFARVMVRRGYGSSVQDIFERYMTRGKPGDVEKEKMTFDTAVGIIKNAGGVPVLPHPASLEFDNLQDFEHALKDLVARGLEGLECYAGMHTPEEAAGYLKIARKHGLLVTGGSDFHGEKPDELGTYAGGMPIPAECIDDLMRLYP
jgi:predicted metal-dependent phosphoesterase TrpH